MPKESTIVKAILKRLRDAGAFAEKIHGNEYTRIGMPDILASYRGVFIGIEVKQPRKYPTESQLQVLGEIRNSGGSTAWMNNVNQVDPFLREIDERTDRPAPRPIRTPSGLEGSREV